MGMYVRAAQFILANRFAKASLDYRWTCHKKLTGLLNHQGKMRNGSAHGTQAGYRAHAGADHRHLTHQFHGGFEAVERRDVGMADDFQGLDAATAAAAIDQSHQWHAHFQRVLFAVPGLVTDLGIGGTTTDREIIATDDDTTPVDPGRAQHEVGRRKTFQLAVFGIAGLARQGADLVKGIFIGEGIDSLPHREATVVMLALDALITTHLFGEFLASP